MSYRGSMSLSTSEYWLKIVDLFRGVDAPRHGATIFDRGKREPHHEELLELGFIRYAGLAGNGYFLTPAGIALVQASL